MGTKETVLKQINKERLIEFARAFVKIPSPCEEESEAARFVAKYMEKKGFQIELQEVEPGRFQTIARLRGSGGGRTLMLNGHLDTDPIGVGWKQDPYDVLIQDGKMFGAGLYNMKAGDISIVEAAEAINDSHISLRGDLLLVFVCGEVQGGTGAVYLMKKGLKANMAVITEPCDLNIATTQGGITQFAITTYGTNSHISAKEKGINAIEKMDKAMHAIWNMKFTCTPRSDLPGLPRHIISTIIGGRGKDYDLRGSAYLSDHCTIITEVRFLPGMSVESVRQDIIRELEKIRTSDPQFKYEIQGPPIPFRNRRYSRQPVEVPKNAEIVQIVKNNHKTVTGKDVEKVGIIPPFVYGGTDACHFYEVGIPSISYGPGELAVNGLAHCEQYVKIDDMMTCAKTLALTAVDVCG